MEKNSGRTEQLQGQLNDASAKSQEYEHLVQQKQELSVFH